MTSLQSPKPASGAGVYRAATWLSGTTTLYLLGWSILTAVFFLSGFTFTIADVDMREAVRHAPVFVIGALYAETILGGITFLLIRRRRSVALVVCLLAIGLQMAIWYCLAIDPYFNGRIGFALFAAQSILAILLWLAMMDRELR